MVGTADEPAGSCRATIAETVPDAQLIEFPGVAHMIQLEAPERFNRLVIDFLTGADLSR